MNAGEGGLMFLPCCSVAKEEREIPGIRGVDEREPGQAGRSTGRSGRGQSYQRTGGSDGEGQVGRGQSYQRTGYLLGVTW
jgi:hypothetical protein